MRTPRGWAHLGFGIMLFGFIIQTLFSSMENLGPVWLYGTFYIGSFAVGIITALKNGRILPNRAQIMGNEPDKLDIIGYIEVYVSVLPVALFIIFMAYYFVVR